MLRHPSRCLRACHLAPDEYKPTRWTVLTDFAGALASPVAHARYPLPVAGGVSLTKTGRLLPRCSWSQASKTLRDFLSAATRRPTAPVAGLSGAAETRWAPQAGRTPPTFATGTNTEPT